MNIDSSDSLYLLLEVINSLTAAFIVTELFRTRKSKALLFQLLTRYGIPWLIANLVVSYLSSIRFLFSTLLYYVYIVFSPLILLAKWFGSTIVIILVIVGLYSLWRQFTSKSGHHNHNYYDFRIAVVCLVLILLKVGY